MHLKILVIPLYIFIAQNIETAQTSTLLVKRQIALVASKSTAAQSSKELPLLEKDD